MNGTAAALRRSVGVAGGGGELAPVATLVVYKDDAGYGMKVSGDNPVYVQSVKEGGAAARAGLHSGDKIIKVNGVDVMQSTHTEVVDLIKASTQVVLTVQQKPVAAGLQSGLTGQQHQRPASLTGGAAMVSPPQPATSLHRASTAPAGGAPCNARITGPQPVDHEKKRQLETQRVHTFQLMLEREQSYVDHLRSELAKATAGSSNADTIATELAGAERRVRTLQDQLATITTNDRLCSLVTNTPSPPTHLSPPRSSSGDVPPPLPSRKSLSMQSLSPPPLPPRPPPTTNTHNIVQSELERHLLTHLTPPTTSHGIPNSFSQGANLGSTGSLNKHQRTKSSPEQLGTTIISPSEASRRLIASESMNDLSPPKQGRYSGINLDDPPSITPPGTPPPPYPITSPGTDSSFGMNDITSNDGSPGLPPLQQAIMSMEDDDMSDQEVGQSEDHGPFKALSKLWEHHSHLAVFINYVLSNSDPSSLLFYLITDLYKEGNAKEMRKWAYEIHSSFLVPGAPLRLNNVSENMVREIDDVLLKEADKEDILRKIFLKARHLAKEELTVQLTDFQQKRTAGLGMLFGPSDAILDESAGDKVRETRIIENILLPKMEPYLEHIEKENIGMQELTTAAALTTILTKIFQVRPVSLDRVPTFVVKDKSNIKGRLLSKNRKMTVRGHHFVAHQFYTVNYCNHCQTIIGGIGPQGYQCSDCSFNVHRQCVRVVDESCLGPHPRKEKGNDRISKLMERIRPERKPPSSHHHHPMHHIERIKRAEEDAGALTDGENGSATPVPEKVSRDKVAKKTKTKSAKARSHVKSSLAGKVWETLGVARRSRGCADDIVETTLIVRLDHITPSATVSSSLPHREKAEEEENSENRKDECFDNDVLKKFVARDSVEPIVPAEESREGDYRGGGATGNARSSSERGRVSAYGGGDHADSMDDPSSREDISEMVQQNISCKPKTSNINRSESYKERIHHKRQLREKRKTSDPNLSKTKAGFSDCEASGTFPGNSAGSSSNSSLSTRSLDSPSTSLEQVHPAASATNASTSSWDSDVDVEPDPPDWSQGVSKEVLARLTNSEKKRQEVINELFYTERSHVRTLKVLSQVFHKPLLENQVLPPDQIQLLFSNLDEMLDIHSGFNQEMKKKKKENPCVGDIGDLLLGMFDGETGEAFECAALTYCPKHEIALEALRNRRRKDPKLNGFFNDVEANHLCRRLQIYDHILAEMLRLTKYPLLFEKLAKFTPASNEKEKAAVLRGFERSKEILSRVNQAVREAENYHRLAEIQRTIDRTTCEKSDDPIVQEFKNIDVTKRKLIHEGPLQWRVLNRAKLVDLHVVLLDDIIFFLHRQEEKYTFKFSNTQTTSNLSPIVRVSTVLVRDNAVDRNSLYLVNTSQKGAQIYELVASSQAERKLWYKHISETVEAYHARDREERRRTPSTMLPEEPVATEPEPEAPEEPQAEPEPEVSGEKPESEPAPREVEPTDDASGEREEEDTPETPGYHPSESEQPQQQQQQQQPQQQHNDSFSAGGGIVTCAQYSLVDPIEARVEERPVHIAESVLTPIERLRRKDEQIKLALAEKQTLVADILNIPQEDFVHVADIASEPSETEKEPAELVLAAVNQANQLMAMLNSALTVTESETVLAGLGSSASIGCEAIGCPAPRVHHHRNQPSVSVATLQPVCNSLTSQLSQLLEIVKQREEERERLRKELRRSREHLHTLDADAQRRESSHIPTITTETQTDPGDSLNGESGSDDINQYEFVDARTEPETNAEAEDVEVDTEVEDLDDSVG